MEEINYSSTNVISAWMICQYLENDNDSQLQFQTNISVNKQKTLVHSVLYGQFSQSELPPKRKWVFLPSAISNHIRRCNTNCAALNDGEFLSPEELDRSKKDKLRIIVEYSKDQSIRLQNVIADNKQFSRYYQVKGSSIQEVNGRYIYYGRHCDASMYRNVRGWCILRQPMDEIPELGIVAANSYKTTGDVSLSESYQITAAEAVQDLLLHQNEIKDGSHNFKRRFIEISRAGNKLISVDQTLQLNHNDQRRADLRSNMSELLLLKLQQSKVQDTANTDEIEDKVQSDGDSSDSNDGDSVQQSEIGDNGSENSTNDVDDFPISGRGNEESTEWDSEVKLTVGKRIHYQTGSQGYLTSHTTRNHPSHEVKANNSQNNAADDVNSEYFSAEGEISAEVMKCIEKREEIIVKMKLEADRLNKLYLEPGSENQTSGEIAMLNTLSPFMDLIHEIRNVTQELANVFGVWARIVHKQKLLIAKRQKKMNLFDSANDPRRYRKFCVIISQKSVHDVYPASQAIVSSSKRLCRSMEPAKIGVENKLVGMYDTREEAEDAFDLAFAAIPQENILLVDKMATSKRVVSLRPCGQHYLIRSNGVSHDIKCEQCLLQNKYKNAKEIIPHIYPEHILSQFVWRGYNYMDKIWTDLDFVDDVHFMKKAFPNETFTSNPLLISNETISEALHALKIGNKDGSNDLFSSKSVDPLRTLRGSHEKLRDAIFAGKAENERNAEKEFQQLYKHSPFKRNLLNDLPLDVRLGTAGTVASMKTTTKSTAELEKSSSKRKTKTLSVSKSNLNTLQLDSLPGTMKNSLQNTRKNDKLNLSKLFSTTQPLTETKINGNTSYLNITNLQNSALGSTKPLPSITQTFSNTDLISNSARNNDRSILFSTLFNTGDSVNDFHSVSYHSKIHRCLYIIGQSTLESESLRNRPKIDHLSDTKKSTAAFPSLLTSASMNETNNTGFPMTDVAFTNTGIPSAESLTTANTLSPNLTMVEAFYSYRGTQLSTVQMRAPVAHRVDDIFCRYDEGEFASFSKGRAIRSFYFQEDQARKGKEKVEERKHMQQLIKDAINVDIVHCDVPYIENLVEQAKFLRGSVLSLDIIQAQSHVKYFHSLVRCTIRSQAQYRGSRARKRVRKIRAEIAFKKKWRLLTEKYSAELALPFVSKIIEQCVKKEVKENTKVLFKFAANFSGQFLVVMVSKLVRRSRKPMKLCISCRTKSTVKIFQPKDRSLKTGRAPCSCRRVECCERWLLKVYNPLTRSQSFKEMDISEVKRALRYIQRAGEQFMNLNYINGALVGDTFGKLQPLFEPNKDTAAKVESINLSFGLAIAMLQARVESSALPLIPRQLSIELRSQLTLNNKFAAFNYKWFESTNNPRTIKDFDGVVVEDVIDEDIIWQPMKDIEKSARFATILEEREEILQKYLNFCQLELQHYRDDAAKKNLEAEVGQFECEDFRSRIMKTMEDINTAEARIQAAMQLSKALITDFIAEEENIREDWRQSYDKVENADGWRGLNCKRKLLRQFEVQIAEYNAVWEKFKPLLDVYIQAKSSLRMAEMAFETAKRDYDRCAALIPSSLAIQSTTKAVAIEAVQTLLTSMNMPLKLKGVRKRRLEITPFLQVFIRDPLERLRQKYRSVFTLLEQKVVGLRPDVVKTLDKRLRSVLRCVVQVLKDPLTGYVILHIGQDQLPVEESTQHLDFGLDKSVFSHLTSHASENDIVLTPSDVVTILKASKQKESSPPKNKPQFPKETRSTTKVFIQSSRGDKFIGLDKTYKLRNFRKEQLDLDSAQQLIKLLKLQPHTGRPCLGLLHFLRRIRYSTEQINKSMWFTDVINSNPFGQNNAVSHRYDVIGAKRMLITIYVTLRQLEIVMKVPYASESFTISLEVTIKRLFSSLTSSPIMLAVFIVELIMNKFSLEMTDYIHRHVDFSVPGSLSSLYWRHYMKDEVPFAAFHSQISTLHRGSIYSCYRFISGSYFFVQVYSTAGGDLRFELKKPEDGKFWANTYRGMPVYIEISKYALRAFIAKVSVFSSLVNERYLSNLFLLHGDNLIDLLTTVLDTIHLNTAFNHHEIYDEDEHDGIISIATAIEGEDRIINIDTIKLESMLKKLYMNYNLWVLNGRSMGNCFPIGDEQIKQMHTWMLEVSNSYPQWKLKAERDINNRQVVPIYKSLSPSMLDLNKFYGCERKSYSVDKSALITSNGDIEFVNDFHVAKYHSHMDVTVRTNTEKSMLYVEFKKADMKNELFQNVLFNEEMKFMFAEDQMSSRVERFVAGLDYAAIVSKQLTELKSEISGLALSLSTLQQKQNMIDRRLARICDSVMNSVDFYFERRARLTLLLMLSGLSISTTKSEIQFEVSQLEEVNFNLPVNNASNYTFPGINDPNLDLETKILIQWASDFVRNMHECSLVRIQDPKHILVDTCEMIQKRKPINGRNTEFMASTSTINFTTSSIPKHIHPIQSSIFDRKSGKSRNPTGYRDPEHWHRERFRKVALVESRATFKSELYRIRPKNVLSRSPNESHLFRISDKHFWKCRAHLHGLGICTLTLFEPNTNKTYLISGCDSNSTFWYQKCFNRPENTTAEKQCYSVLRGTAVNFAFKVITHGTINALSESIKSRHHEKYEEISRKVNSLLEDQYRLEQELLSLSRTSLLNRNGKLPCSLIDRSSSQIATNVESAKKIDVYGICIPQDQSLGVEFLHINASNFMAKCFSFLRISEQQERVRREKSLIGLVYYVDEPAGTFSSGGDTHNKRVQYLIEKFYDNLGWREGNDQLLLLDIIRRDEESLLEISQTTSANDQQMGGFQNRQQSVFVGDVVLLFRHGNRDLPIVRTLLEELDNDYAPKRYLRLLKEGKEKLWRQTNHAKFSTFVFQLANVMLKGVEALYSYKNSSLVADVSGVLPFPVKFDVTIPKTWIESRYVHRIRMNQMAYLQESRALIIKFKQLIDIEAENKKSYLDKSKPLTLSSYQQALLLDSNSVYFDDEQLLRFDFVQLDHYYFDCTESFFRNYVRDSCNTQKDSANPPIKQVADNEFVDEVKVEVSAGQLVYAIFKLHCFSCKEPLNVCKFPGCSIIRGCARVTEVESIDTDMGSGLHIIETCVRDFLFTCDRTAFNFFPSFANVNDMSAAEEELEEKIQDDNSLKQQLEIDASKFTWSEISVQVNHLRNINHLLLRPELRDAITAFDVVKAKGGQQQAQIEEYVAHNDDDILSIRLKSDVDATNSDNIRIAGDQHLYQQVKMAESSFLPKSTSSVKSKSPKRMSSHGKWILSSRERASSTALLNSHKKASTIASLSVSALRDAVDVISSGFRGNSTLPKSANILDPYPAARDDHVQDESYPLPKYLFDWIMSRLEILRPLRLPGPTDTITSLYSSSKWHSKEHNTTASTHNSSALHNYTLNSRRGNKTKKSLIEQEFSQESGELTVGFDRLLSERVVRIPGLQKSSQSSSSGSYMVIVQVLHGILDGASFISCDKNGVPESAVRFCATSQLSNMKPGLTISVYDYHSRVTRATSLNQKAMLRVAQHFHSTADNCPYLAKQITNHAESCLQLSRVAGFCTGVTFNATITIPKIDNPNPKRLDTPQMISKKSETIERIGNKYTINTGNGQRRMRLISNLIHNIN